MITIYHNPRCSKSREALSLIQQISTEKALPLTIINYLETPPDAKQLARLLQQLGCTAEEMVRSNEEEFGALGLDKASHTELLEAIARHPKLMQRPIVCYEGRAVIARPPERLLALF